jgi:hypothetical protein
MRADPINASVERLVEVLVEESKPVVAELEPGDGTYYSLLITPAWSRAVEPCLGRWGIPESAAGDWLLVTKLDQTGPMASTWVNWKSDVGFHTVAKLSDFAWTQELLFWWLELLVGQVRETVGRLC